MQEELIAGWHFPGDAQPESRFITPTDLCPHPQRWTSTDGDSTEVEVSLLIAAFVIALQPDFVLETGTAFGQTTALIGQALARNGRGRLVSLETDGERIPEARERCAGLPVEILQVDSLDYLPQEQLDFVLFDSLYEYRIPEFLRYRPWLRTGAIVAFHDTAPEHGAHRIASGRDLRSEIEAELAGQIRFIHLPTPRGITLAEVLEMDDR